MIALAANESTMPPLNSSRAALIVAHPGHELRVHHWLEKTKPLVLVLTDGSGRTGQSRLASTTHILQTAGAVPGSVYGRFSDTAIYDAILHGRQELFLALLKEIADELIAAKVDLVAGDALEGYNSSHDLCRFLIGPAVELAQYKSGRQIKNFDFTLTGRPDECPADLRANAITVLLDNAAVDRKLAAARGYPELAQEVEGALRQFGKELFSVEWLRPVSNRAGMSPSAAGMPYYEKHGEKQVAAGHYARVIRLREHMLPLAQALWNHVEQCAA